MLSTNTTAPVHKLRTDHEVWHRFRQRHVSIPAGTEVELYEITGTGVPGEVALVTVIVREGDLAGFDFVTSADDLKTP